MAKKRHGFSRVSHFVVRQGKKDLKFLKKAAPIIIAVVGVAVPVVGIAGGILLAGMKAYEKKRAVAKAAKKEAALQAQEEAAYFENPDPPRAQTYAERSTRAADDNTPNLGAYDTVQSQQQSPISRWFASLFG